MSRASSLLQLLANLAVGLTGLVYAWMRYVLEPAEAWDVVNHPLQPAVQHLHVVTAPLLVFATGIAWSEHVIVRWQSGPRGRRSGLGLLVTFFPMVASGVLLQVTSDEGLRKVWVWTHVITSLLWLAGFVVHFVRGRLRRASTLDGLPWPNAGGGPTAS